jgi:hypothetical protein
MSVRENLEKIKKKSTLTIITGVIISILGAFVAFTGIETKQEAEKALIRLDQVKLGEGRLQ